MAAIVNEVKLLGYRQPHPVCQYCQYGQGFASYAISCGKMKAIDLQNLINQNWTRSGFIHYRPDLRNSCCQILNTRLNVNKFVISKKQKQRQRKFDRFINGAQHLEANKRDRRIKNKIKVAYQLQQILQNAIMGMCMQLQIEFSNNYVKIQRNLTNHAKKYGDYTTSSAFLVKQQNKAIDFEIILIKIRENLDELLKDTIWKVISCFNGYINIKQQGNIHLIERPDILKYKTYHAYTNVLKQANKIDKKAFKLYKKYQMIIHKEDPSQYSMMQFFWVHCYSAVKDKEPCEKYPLGLGLRHLKHKLDGKLIAVSVIDVLPNGISSNYFFYDPDFKFLNLGTISILQEIELVKQNRTQNFKYYYLGHYIDNCQKLRYKGHFYPIKLLLPQQLKWKYLYRCNDQNINKDLAILPRQFKLNEWLIRSIVIKLQTSQTLNNIEEPLKSEIRQKLQEAAQYFSMDCLKAFTFNFNL